MAKWWQNDGIDKALCNVRMVAKVMSMVAKVNEVFSFNEKMPKTKHLHDWETS